MISPFQTTDGVNGRSLNNDSIEESTDKESGSLENNYKGDKDKIYKNNNYKNERNRLSNLSNHNYNNEILNESIITPITTDESDDEIRLQQHHDQQPPQIIIDKSIQTPQRKINAEKTFYSLSIINQHDKPNDLWMIIYNRVYDITNFSCDHPGGAEVLFDCGGCDATEAFDEVGHSIDALNMLNPYYIGNLIEDECINYKKFKNPKSNNEIINEKKILKLKRRKKLNKKKLWEKLTFILLILLALLALTLHFYIQKRKWDY